MLGIDTEYDGLLEAVAAFFEELSDLLGDELGAVVENEGAVEVLLIINAVFDLVAVAVHFALFRAVAFHVFVDVHFYDLVGCEETVADALFERVGVDGVAEVIDVGNVFGFLRGSSETDLCGTCEVVEDLAPCGVFGCAASMALVDHDHIEEVGGQFLEKFLSLFGACDRLVEAEIDLVGGVDTACLAIYCGGELDLGAVFALDSLGIDAEFGHGLPEGAEVVDHGLIDQDIAVGEEEDALFAACFPQAPDDLKGGKGFARARRHDE